MRTLLETYPDDEIYSRGGFPMRVARVAFEIPAYFAPVELDFVLVRRDPFSNAERTDGPSLTADWRASTFALPLGMGAGVPSPLGASRFSPTSEAPGWVNFALHSATAAKVTLFLQWTSHGEAPETLELALNPTVHKTGDVWHVALPFGIEGCVLPVPAHGKLARTNHSECLEQATDIPAVLYGYKCDGDPTRGGWRFHPALVMFDPRAILLVQPLGPFPDPHTVVPKLMGSLADVIYGGDDQLPKSGTEDTGVKMAQVRQIPAQEVIYELSIANFTSHITAQLPPGYKGTFAGVLSKVEYIISTGATTVLLDSVTASFNRKNIDAGGSAPISFFAPDPAYANSEGGSITHQLREMVRGLQARGLEVLLHTIFTHMGEGTDEEPLSVSLRGIDPYSYYKVDTSDFFESNRDLPGTMMLDPQSVATQRLILDALRHWRTYFGVDGFVVNWSSTCELRQHSMLLESIALDPVLGGGAGLGATMGGGVRTYLNTKNLDLVSMHNFGFVNTSYGVDIMRFFESVPGSMVSFSARICGSASFFRDPRCTATRHVLNVLTGLQNDTPLADSAREVLTRANMESKLLGVLLRSLLACLFVSDGVPVISSGDEYGHTRVDYVSSSAAFRDDVDAFRWEAVEDGSEGAFMRSFVEALGVFRHRRADLFSMGGNNVSWTGLDGLSVPDWKNPSAPSVLMCRRRAAISSQHHKMTTQDALMIFNGTAELASAVVGHPPHGFVWVRIADTSLTFPSDCALSFVNMAGPQGTYLVAPLTVLVLELAPAPAGYGSPAAEMVVNFAASAS